MATVRPFRQEKQCSHEPEAYASFRELLYGQEQTYVTLCAVGRETSAALMMKHNTANAVVTVTHIDMDGSDEDTGNSPV